MSVQLPTVKQLLENLEKTDQPQGMDACFICLESFGVPRPDGSAVEHAVKLPCAGRHVLGSACIAKWLSQDGGNNTTCPMCREELCRPDQITTLHIGGHQQRLQVILRTLFPADRPNFGEEQPAARAPVELRPAAVTASRYVDREVGESQGLAQLRLWLRRRSEPNPPTEEADILRWSHENRRRAARIHAESQDTNRGRERRIRQRETELYNELRGAGVSLPPLRNGSHGPEINHQQETAFLRELAIRGAFDAQPGSARRRWQRGASIRAIWEVLHEEGYTYAQCFGDAPARSWYGWVRIP